MSDIKTITSFPYLGILGIVLVVMKAMAWPQSRPGHGGG